MQASLQGIKTMDRVVRAFDYVLRFLFCSAVDVIFNGACIDCSMQAG